MADDSNYTPIIPSMSGGFRKFSASPRIRELASRFESPDSTQNGSNSSSSNNIHEEFSVAAMRKAQTVRMRLGDLDWTPRIMTDQEPSRSRSVTMKDAPTNRQALKQPETTANATISNVLPSSYERFSSPPDEERRPVEGLPASSGSTSLHIHLRNEKANSYQDAQIKEIAQKGITSDRSLDESIKDDNLEEKNITLNDEDVTLDHLPILASYQPFPAHQIFAHNAFRLHLPRLDQHLANDEIFSSPNFTEARSICSREEFELYEYNPKPSQDRHKLEVCGAQIRVSRIKIRDKRQARLLPGRDNGVDGDEEETMSPCSQNDEKDTCNVEERDSRCSLGPTSGTCEKMPPLMLLEQNNLDELKSNAVGPRKPPGGFLSYFPSLASLLGTIVDFVIGAEGSSMAAGIFRLQLLVDFVQLTSLNTLFSKTANTATLSKVNNFALVTLPSLLALDFVSVFGYTILVFLVWILLAAILLLYFWKMIHKYNPNRTLEGYRSQPWLFRPFSRNSKEGKRSQELSLATTFHGRSTPWSKFVNIFIVFLLTVLYIPLGKLALDAVVWNSDYWPVGSSSLFLDNPEVYRDPSRVCYTTTMRRDEFNWAYVIVLMAILTIFFYTLWLPFAMRRAITPLLPRISKYNELGQLRSSDELDAEYMRLLGRDSSPLSFLYNAYKRKWGNYKPLYLIVFKFSNILIISILAQDNCLWRKYQPRTMLVTQESVLIVFQCILLLAHILILPFVDHIGNRSELVSRGGYVINNVFGLLVALKVNHYSVFHTWLLYIVYAITYTANLYFALASTVLISHWIKRLQHRIDFSIDIFSPRLDLAKHIKRRIWQETLSIVLLTGSDYHMPENQLVTFQVINEKCPPDLLSFQGSIAERHVENLKIIKQVGLDTYQASCEDLRGKEAYRWNLVLKKIEEKFCGPDAYWKPFHKSQSNNVTTYFGTAVLVPFPPTIVFDYDQVSEDDRDGAVINLTTLSDMEAFVHQNSSEIIQRRKWVRSVLRAMDGQRVHCPHERSVKYESNKFVNAFSNLQKRGQYSIAKSVYYTEGTLNIRKKISRGMNGYNLQAGFDVSITYTFGQRKDAEGMSIERKKVIINAANAFGLSDDFERTTSVRHFFHANHHIIQARLPLVQSTIEQYRHEVHSIAKTKRKVMDYCFHIDIFNQPILTHAKLRSTFHKARCIKTLQHLPKKYPATMTLLLERLEVLSRSQIHQWWYLFWDDLWRKNSNDYKGLRNHQRIFCPQYSTSLAWTPMPRTKLEEILKSRVGLWSDKDGEGAIFSHGLLNQVYFTMEEITFTQRHSDAIEVGVADNNDFPQKTSISQLSSFPQSRLTGGGTDHDEDSVLNRRQWSWTEQRLGAQSNEGVWQKMKQFLALNPYITNAKLEDVWIYARLVRDSNGQQRYEAERSKTSGVLNSKAM